MGSIFRLPIIALSLFILLEPLYAGGLSRFFFDPQGKRLEALSEIADDSLSFTARVKKLCPNDAAKICLQFQIVPDGAADSSNLRERLEYVLQRWVSDTSIPLDYSIGPDLSDNALPLIKDLSGSPILDSFGNLQYRGNFIVSFKPPSEITFNDGEVSKTKNYILPDLLTKTGEILWSGIFFNPALRRNFDYDLTTSLFHEIGRALGLAPSGVRNSVMYPFRVERSVKSDLTLEDVSWLGRSYGSELFKQSTGTIRGRVIDGGENKPWVGAQILALPYSKVSEFEKSLDRGLFVAGGLTHEDGEFEIPGLTPDKYVLLLESVKSLPFDISLLDLFQQKFASTKSFEPEFYDGKDRESNLEAILTFSPQSIYYAAQIVVEAAQETSDVVFVTNIGDNKKNLISAPGSSSEILSQQTPPDTKKVEQVDAGEASESADGDSGGCSLNVNSAAADIPFNLLGLVFVLFLVARAIRDQKVR